MFGTGSVLNERKKDDEERKEKVRACYKYTVTAADCMPESARQGGWLLSPELYATADDCSHLHRHWQFARAMQEINGAGGFGCHDDNDTQTKDLVIKSGFYNGFFF